MNSNQVPIPVTTSDITPQWVARVIGEPVSEEGLEVEGDIQAGIGYLSSMHRVKFRVKGNGEDGSHLRQIIVKLQPTNDFKDIAIDNGVDQREIFYYTKVASDLVSVVPQIEIHLCKCYHASSTLRSSDSSGINGGGSGSLIVLEDLKASGFQMAEKNPPPEVVRSALSFSALLHVGGHALEVRAGIPLPQLYPPLFKLSEEEDWYKSFCPEADRPGAYSNLAKFFNKSGFPSELGKKFLELEPCTSKLVRVAGREVSRFPCLIHGDFWLNNVLQHATTPTSVPTKIIDWQWLGYSDATIDLSFMLLTALPPKELTKSGLSKWIRLYFDEFEKLCEQRGEEFSAKVKRRSWEEFEQFFFTWSMVVFYLIFMPFLDIFENDMERFRAVFLFLAEEVRLPELIQKACTN